MLRLDWAAHEGDEDDDVILGEKEEVRCCWGNFDIVKLQMQPECPVYTTGHHPSTLSLSLSLASPPLSLGTILGGLLWGLYVVKGRKNSRSGRVGGVTGGVDRWTVFI